MGKSVDLIVDGDSWIEYLLNNTKADFTFGGEYDVLWFETWTFLNKFYTQNTRLQFFFSGRSLAEKIAKTSEFSPKYHFAVKEIIIDAILEFQDFTLHQCVQDSITCILSNSSGGQWILSERNSFPSRIVIRFSEPVNHSIPGSSTVKLAVKKKKSKGKKSKPEISGQLAAKIELEYKPKYETPPAMCCTDQKGDKFSKLPKGLQMKYRDGYIPCWLMMPMLYCSVPYFHQNEDPDMEYSFRCCDEILQLAISILLSKTTKESIRVEQREKGDIIQKAMKIRPMHRKMLTTFYSTCNKDVMIYSEMCKELNVLYPKVDFGTTIPIPLFYRIFVCSLLCWLEKTTVAYPPSLIHALVIYVWMMMATCGRLRQGHEQIQPFGTQRAQTYWVRMFSAKRIEKSRQQFQIYFEKPHEVPKEKHDRALIHAMAEFQSCLYMMMCLNCIIREPEYGVPMWIMFNGTFVYNLTKALSAVKGKRGFIEKLFCCRTLTAHYFAFLELISRATDKIGPLL